jgi:osmoprotectant transport system substrate-binding protein
MGGRKLDASTAAGCRVGRPPLGPVRPPLSLRARLLASVGRINKKSVLVITRPFSLGGALPPLQKAASRCRIELSTVCVGQNTMAAFVKYAAGALALLSALGCSRARPLTVGSKNFTEQIVLGEILAQQLERRLGAKIDRKLDLGGTLLAHQALRNGEIDLYPEYTGTALTAVLKLPPSSDAAAVLERVRAEYRRRWRLEWLDPFGFDNTFAMVVRGPDARAQGIETLTDASRRKQGWTLGVGYEFLQRPDGLPGLLSTYHLPLAAAPKSMDLGLLYSALEQKQVDMAAANATDGMLSVLDVKVLGDDRHYFPPYQAAVIVRAEALAAYPGLRAALDQLSGKLSAVAMRDLNHQVDGKHRPVAEVARDWLAAVR